MKLSFLLLLVLSLSSLTFAQHYGRDGEGGHGGHGYYGYYYHYKPKSPKTPTPTPPPPPPTPPTPIPPTPPLNTQECSDNLGELMDAAGNTLMDNSCTPFVLNDDQRFRFEVSFLAPYIFNDECLDLEVVYEETILANGAGELNEWQFDADTQTITWNISLGDFVDVYGCEWIADDDQFTWICNFKVNIYFMDMIQQCYNAKIQVTLDRVYENELIVNVVKNEVEGECCENELNLQTQLRFCETFECISFLPSPLTVIRKEDFYVELSIVTPGFADFSLSLVSVTLADFLPVIVDQANEQGRIRLALRSNIAKPNLVLTVIAQLQKPGNGGRFLQEQVRDDYKVKGTQDITVINTEESNVRQQLQQNLSKKQLDQQVQSNDDGLIIGAVITFALLFAAVSGVSVFCYMQRKSKLQSAKQQKCETESDEQLA